MIIHGYLPEIVDHIDCNTLNNKAENLRPANKNQSQRNKKLSKNNKSGVKGVFWYSKINRWRAQVRVNGKYKRVGDFKSIEHAKSEIKKARELYHKDFCNHG